MITSNCCGAPIVCDDMCSKCLEHCDIVDDIMDDYPVLPVQPVDDSYKRVSKWFGVGLALIIIILILL